MFVYRKDYQNSASVVCRMIMETCCLIKMNMKAL